MPVDSLTLAAILTEAKPSILGGRLTALGQPDRGVVSLSGRTPDGGTWHWRIDLRDGVARAHLSDDAIAKGPVPPWLLQIRKHVEGGRILGIEQAPWERVIRFRVAGRDTLGDPRPYGLVMEIVGRYSLICMVDEITNTIVASSRLVDETMSRYRQIAPGLPYALPPGPGDRRNLDACSDEQLSDLCQQGTAPWAPWVSKTFAGLGKDRVAELTAELPDDEAAAELARRLGAWRDAWRQGSWHRVETTEPRAAVGIGELSGLNLAIDHYYRQRQEADVCTRLRQQLQQQVDQHQDKVNEQLAAIAERWEGCHDAERLQQEAELLQGNLYRIEAGADSVTVEDYFDPAFPTVTLPLDPDLSPSGNVQDRFRRAQKAQRQREHLRSQREALQVRSWELDEVTAQIGQATTRHELEELASVVLPEEKARGTAAAARRETAPERYRSSDGLTVLVGRSSRQNEAILHDLSRGQDLWLHAQNIPGAHVLVQVPKGTSVPDRTLEEAACLAAYFSKARHSTHVPVVAVPRRFVRQPKGAAPGFVHYANEQALWVDPNPETLPPRQT